MADTETTRLVKQWRAGDEQAASALVERYMTRLMALARNKLPTKCAARLDPEDVVQSVYRTFFAGAREGRFELQRGGDLWRLLVTITLHKVHNQVKWNAAAKRAVKSEQAFGAEAGLEQLQPRLLASAPSPLDVVVLLDEVEQLMRAVPPVERRMLELRLQGYTLDEIATDTNCCQRTVRRVLERVKQQLEQGRVHTSDS